MLLIILALALLVLPMQWLLAIVLAAAFHELCHYWAVRLCGGEIHRITLGLTGARMEVSDLRPDRELICALAGPLGGLCLLIFVRWFPRTAICAAAQSLYNLLPVYPLDGGRALRCALEWKLPMERAKEVCLWIERICLVGIVVLGLYGMVKLRLGVLPLLLSLMIFGKIACKPGRH